VALAVALLAVGCSGDAGGLEAGQVVTWDGWGTPDGVDPDLAGGGDGARTEFGSGDALDRDLTPADDWLDPHREQQEGVDDADPGDSVAPQASLSFLTPGSEAANPVTFTVQVTGPITRVAYSAENQWPLGESSDAANHFPVTYSFNYLGPRQVWAHGFDAAGTELAQASLDVVVKAAPVTGENQLGAWLWKIEYAEMTHEELADALAQIGVKRIYIKVCDGSAFYTDGSLKCDKWPELCTAVTPDIYHQRGIQAWAWSYNYPGTVVYAGNQAEALYRAAKLGYDGYVLDLEAEFDDGEAAPLEMLLQAFHDARLQAREEGLIDQDWPLYETTYGWMKYHSIRLDVMDPYVDGHMPQAYIEYWSTWFDQPAQAAQAFACEYRSLGAAKPIHSIVSFEHGDNALGYMTAAKLNAFFQAAGPEASLWRIPGYGVSMSFWDTWESVDWNQGDFSPAPQCE
jgi:hypothetical protein